MPSKNNVKFIGIVLFLIGFGFVFANFLAPHTSAVEASVEVPHQVTVPHESTLRSYSNYVLETNHYSYLNPVGVSAGQTVKLTWSADASLTAYIFTQNQFNNYNKSGAFGVNYMATGEGRSGTLTYDVKNSDTYTAIIRNAGGLIGGSSAQIYEFKLTAISYPTETQYTTEIQTVQKSDSLYLYLGFAVIAFGIAVFAVLQKVFPR